MKKKGLLLIFVFMLVNVVFSQGVNPSDWGLKAFDIADKQLGDIHYYVSEKGIDQNKPIYFIISGTRGLPIMLVVQGGEKSVQLGVIPPDMITFFANDYHVAMISKVGTPFCDTMKVEQINPYQNLEDYQPSREYVENCGMEWEIAASKAVIADMLEKLPVNDKVIVAGFSEGGETAIRLAAECDKVTHLVSVVSSGLNQFYSTIINYRIDAATGKYTHEQAQAKIDSLFMTYEEIYRNPESTDKWYWGHPYKRWASFNNYIPLDDLVKLDIPILFLNGTRDRNTPILQADYVKLEFIRLGKNNLTYQAIPDMEHSLYKIIVKDGQEQGVSYRNEAFNIIKEWVDGN